MSLSAERVNRRADHWIEETVRPYYLSVQEMVDSGSARQYNIDPAQIEACVFDVMLVLDKYAPDTMLAAISVLFISVVRSFGARLASLIQLGESYYCGDDHKPSTTALKWMLDDHFERTVSRYDTVKLSKPVNVTEVFNKPQGDYHGDY